MTRRYLFICCGLVWLVAQAALGQPTPAPAAAPEYLPNKGQWPAAVRLQTDVAPGLRLFAEAGRLVWLRYDAAAWAAWAHDATHEAGNGKPGHSHPAVPAHAWAVEFVGAAPGVVPRPEGPATGPVRNYLLGRDARHWATGVRGTAAARYTNLWPDIDLRLHASDAGEFEYDVEVRPGADPTRVALRYTGLEHVGVDAHGHLHLRTALGELTEAAPVAWQTDPATGRRQPVVCRFELRAERPLDMRRLDRRHEKREASSQKPGSHHSSLVTFAFPAGFDHTRPLTIDPVLVFATHSGSTAPVFGHTATYDRFGHLYAAGPCYDPGYPTTLGAFDLTHSNDSVRLTYNNPDVAISRYAPDGHTLRYATYLGGTAADYPHSLLVNHRGELLILGSTGSANFPTTAASFDPSYNQSQDLFVARLDSTGSQLLSSTYLGGQGDDGVTWFDLQFFYGDAYRGDLEVDSLDRVYVATTTRSADFPFTAGAVRPPAGFSETAVALRLTADLSHLDWAAGLGINASAYSLHLPPSGAPYVVGTTISAGFPTTAGTLAPDSTRNVNVRQRDGFIAQLSPMADSVRVSTYLRVGTIGQPISQTFFVQGIPGSTDVVVLGSSTGRYPKSSGKWGQIGGGLVLQRLSPALSQRRWATTIGHPVTDAGTFGVQTDNLSPTAFLVDRCGALYVSAWGHTTGLATTANALQDSTDGQDLYMLVLTPDAARLEYATFLGGHAANHWPEEHVDGGTSRFDPQGRIYQAICTNSPDFPTTAGSWSPQMQVANSAYDEVSVKLDFERRLVQAVGTALDAGGGAPSHLTVPTTVQFVNRSTTFPGTTYQWTFGDGSALSTAFAPQHTYTRTGTFGVTLIVRDAGSCAGADTTRFQLTVHRPDTVAARAFSICRGDSVQLIGALLEPGSFAWSPASSLSDSTAVAPWAHPDSTTTYTAFGTLPGSTQRIRWNVTVMVRDELQVAAAMTAVGGGPASGQPAPAVVQFANTTAALPVTRWVWHFGDGSAPDTARAPQHTFTRAGTYTIWLVGASPNACNGADSVQLTLTVNRPDTVAAQAFSICRGDSIQLTGVLLQPGSFSWTPAGSLSDSTSVAPWAHPDTTTTYTAFGLLPGSSQRIRWNVTVTVLDRMRVGAAVLAVGGGSADGQPVQTPLLFYTTNPRSNTTTWLWRFGDGTTSTLDSVQHAYSRPGTYTIWLIGRSPNTCNLVDSTQLTLTVIRPDTVAAQAFSICRGDSVQLTGVLLQPGSFSWSPATSLSSDTVVAPWAHPDSTTTYTAFGTLPGSTQRIRWNVTVTVRERLRVAASAPAGNLVAPATVQLVNTTPAVPATRWVWHFDDGSAPDTARAPQHTFTRAGTYLVRLIGRSPNACNGADTTYLLLTVLPADTAAALTLTICRGDSVQFPKLLAPGSVHWSPDSTLSDATALTPWAAPHVTTTYEATGQAAWQPNRRLTLRVTVVVNQPQALAWTTEQRCLPGGTTVTFRLTEPIVVPTAATWDFGDGTTAPLTGPTNSHTYALPPGNRTYDVTLRGRDANGCALTARQDFQAESFLMPNVITPGALDGQNDVFQLPCFEPGTATLQVYNRWGRQVYDSGPNQYANDWRAADLPAGTYFYTLRLTYAPAPYQGWVEVVR